MNINKIKVEEIIKNLSLIKYPNYNDLIEATNCEIIDSLRLGSYQGDLLMVVRKDNKFGFMSTGYGSCSGCDALQSCDNIQEYAELAKTLYNKIIWKEPEEIIDYLENKDWVLEYYGGESEIPSFIKNVKEIVLIRYLAGF